MNLYAKILVGVDFLPASISALRQTLRIAHWNRATVRAVHIVTPAVILDPMDSMGYIVAGINEQLMETARQQWKELTESIPGAQGVHFEVYMDSLVGGLTRKAEAMAANLLVMGSGKQGGNLRAGPVATGCVRRCGCDVLLVRNGHDKPYTTVLACVDFSLTSKRAVMQAMRVANQDGARLIVVHAFTSPWKRLFANDKPEARAAHEDALKDALAAKLKAFCESELHEAGFVQPTYQIIELDRRSYGIGAYAQSIGADLVVLGKRGHRNLRDIVLGSTAEQILGEAPCSALVVQPLE